MAGQHASLLAAAQGLSLSVRAGAVPVSLACFVIDAGTTHLLNQVVSP